MKRPCTSGWLQRIWLSLLLAGTWVSDLHASDHLDAIPLWPNCAPGAMRIRLQDIPTLTAFLPDPSVATGTAPVICPGGACGFLAPHEGGLRPLFCRGWNRGTCFEVSFGIQWLSLSGHA